MTAAINPNVSAMRRTGTRLLFAVPVISSDFEVSQRFDARLMCADRKPVGSGDVELSVPCDHAPGTPGRLPGIRLAEWHDAAQALLDVTDKTHRSAHAFTFGRRATV